MWQTLITSDDFATVAFWALVCGAFVATAAMEMWRKHQATKMATELKLEMLARGMSADEIERVIAVRPGNSKGPAPTQPDAKK
jgi:hypothetical protein